MESLGPSRTEEKASLMMQNRLFHLRAEEMRVELDKKSLFALASDTRVEILRALQPMRRTVSQLSEALSIDKAAVYRHLKKMEDGGLVKRYEDHGFVYYGLSWKARDLLSPNENTKIVVLLSASWILTVITVFVIVAALFGTSSSSLFGAERFLPSKGGEISYDDSTHANASEGIVQKFYYSVTAHPIVLVIFGVPAVACGAGASILAIKGLRMYRRPRQRKGGSGGSPSIQIHRLDD